MSQDQNRNFFDKYAKGQNLTTVNNTTYTTTNNVNTTAVNQGYTATYTTSGQSAVRGQTTVVGGQTVYGGQTGYSTTSVPTDYKLVNQTYASTTGGYSRIGQNAQTLVQKVVAEEIPVESRIQYIPFEKKYIEYDQIERIERIPYERQIVEYEEVTRTERVPVQRTITDYYAVQTQIQYIPKQIEQTIVEYEPVERVWERVQYLPVETQIVHYPERDNYVPGPGRYIQAGYVQGTTGYQTSYQQGSTYVPSQSGVRTETVYQTGYSPVGGAVVRQGGLVSGGQTQYVSGGQSQYVTGQTQYVSGPTYTTGTTYTTGQTYVTGGSGVRGQNVYRASQTGGYVTGGSGVRQ